MNAEQAADRLGNTVFALETLLDNIFEHHVPVDGVAKQMQPNVQRCLERLKELKQAIEAEGLGQSPVLPVFKQVSEEHGGRRLVNVARIVRMEDAAHPDYEMTKLVLDTGKTMTVLGSPKTCLTEIE